MLGLHIGVVALCQLVLVVLKSKVFMVIFGRLLRMFARVACYPALCIVIGTQVVTVLALKGSFQILVALFLAFIDQLSLTSNLND